MNEKRGFWHRLKFYLIGLSIGVAAIAFIYKDKALDAWMPKKRIKIHLTEVEVKFNDLATCQMQCFGLDEETVLGMIQDGEIHFNESQTRRKPCPIYLIRTEYERGFNYEVDVEYCLEEGRVWAVRSLDGTECGCQ